MKHFVTLAKTGDRAPGGQRMTPTLIEELEQRFSDVGRVPVTFGRLQSDSEPKAGNVTAVKADGDELKAVVKPVDGMEGHVSEDAFSDLTAGVARKNGGGYYLHHVEADATPPKWVQRLTRDGKTSGVPSATFSDPSGVIRFGDGPSRSRTEDLAKHM